MSTVPRIEESDIRSHEPATAPDGAIGMTRSYIVAMENKEIDSLAKQIATANLTSAIVTSVVSSQAVDSTGNPALQITIVLAPGSTDKIGGDAALNTLVRLQQALQERGEDRFPIVEYATEDELLAGGD
jgi:hypothetical protein